MTCRPHTLRRDRRANVGFAVVAVALLIVGSAAALYLRSIEEGKPDVGAAGHGDAFRTEARSLSETLSAMAAQALDGALAQVAAFGTDGSPSLVGAVRERVDRWVAEAYPRLAPSGLTVSARVASLTVSPASGWAEVPSYYGGNTPENIPLFLAAEGLADMTVSAPGGATINQTVAYTGQSSTPAALPLELVARAGAELLPGGMAERFASQAAQAILPTSNVSSFAQAGGPEVVRSAVRATLLWAFRASGNASFDARALEAARGSALLFAGDLEGGSHAADDEPVDLSAAGLPFAVGDTSGATLRVTRLDESNLSVTVTRSGFSGQERGPGIWQAVEVQARGDVSFSVEVNSSGGTARVGPLQLPVSFVARAAAGPLPPALVVPPEMVGAAEQMARGCSSVCAVAEFLANLGLTIDATTNMTAALRQGLLSFVASQMEQGLPPVEDAATFLAAYGPPRLLLHPLRIRVVGPGIQDGATATLTVDGAAAGSAPVVGGTATVARAPEGTRTVGLSVACGEDTCSGGAAVDGNPGVVEVTVAPAPDSPFLSSVTRRSVVDNLTLGEAALRQAEALLGLVPDGDPAARASAAMARADALLLTSRLSAVTRGAVEEAASFLKVTMLVLKAADAARKAAGAGSAPLAQAAGNAATLVIAPETRLLLVATVHGSEILRAAMSNGSIELSSPWGPDGRVLTLDFRLQQAGLVATAALSGLTLGADVVRIQREADEGDAAGLAIAAGRFAAHTADTLRELSLGIIKVADRVFATAGTEALATTFAKASVVLGAIFLVLDVADLYHDAGGNLSLMADGLLHPAAVAGMLTLPSLAQAAASTGAGAVLLMAGESVAAAGPVGIVAGLLVLAGVILLNGQTFASAAFHALNTDQREQFASALGNRTRDLATVLAFANGANTSASVAAARASAVASARLSGAARTANSLSDAQRLATAAGAARADAERLASRASVERTLRHAALAAMEEMDDFAGGIHIGDLGRDTEGYGVLQKLTPDGYRPFPYGGDLGVSVPNGDGMRPLPRNEWRALLRSLTGADLDTTVFSYHLTETDGIPVDEANRFVAACQAAGGLLNLQLQRYQALAA